ncbi:MarR family winged helix-turn-helix transcriptional regulator [Beijerinckia indica]|uniref:Transcriptional regulator, MarR family n=1 Tax=Beijerinckia indica subsp. indica (strain ATCC 9039 / DSM 1715 / NCIMB 8712) TaxID=395963 RepID=B2IJK3_BEII9|nr:MarR family transcriptional regulator [Beijerinckia indica]ACB94877.1 transcriptional regulator, MarR family [Beijerinckia indica subsp. indica ATCC 9039]
MADEPQICSCAALRQATRHVSRLYDEALAPLGLSLNQYSILAKLSRFGPHTVQALADRLVMDRSTLGHLLRPLERAGWIKIGVSPSDKRQRVISLTPSGSQLMQEAQPLWARAEQRFQSLFGEDNVRMLQTVMKQVIEMDLTRA